MALKSTQVFTTQTSNADSTVVDMPDSTRFGNVVVSGTGTFTVKLQHSVDGGTTYVDSDTTDGQVTASGSFNFELNPRDKVRLNLSDASGASVDAWISF